jgi:hypothetical protein
MALQTSGQISLSNIATEFEDSAPHSMSEFYDAASGIPASGQISISDFYGASAVLPHPFGHYNSDNDLPGQRLDIELITLDGTTPLITFNQSFLDFEMRNDGIYLLAATATPSSDPTTDFRYKATGGIISFLQEEVNSGITPQPESWPDTKSANFNSDVWDFTTFNIELVNVQPFGSGVEVFDGNNTQLFVNGGNQSWNPPYRIRFKSDGGGDLSIQGQETVSRFCEFKITLPSSAINEDAVNETILYQSFSLQLSGQQLQF